MKKNQIILDVAIDLFLANGFDGTGIEQIITKANASRGGLYHHFKDKQTLFEAVLDKLFIQPMQSMSFDNFANMPLKKQQSMLVELFRTMPHTMDAMTRHGVGKYFVLYFDSLTRVPKFGTTVRNYYVNLLTILQNSMVKERGLTQSGAALEARAFLARLEGEIYLCAVLGDAPELSKLTKELEL